MGYYKVILKRSEIYEVVVKAKDVEGARKIASDANEKDLEPIEVHPMWIYDVVELQPKQETLFRGEYTDTL
jgi:hypothetical protein